MKALNNPLYHILTIAIITFAIYWQSTNYKFVLDDKIVITENSFVKKGIKGISGIWNNDSMSGFLGKENNLLQGGRYRPLSLIVFALGYELWGLNTFYYHLLNLIFYVVACVLLYYLLYALFEVQKDQNRKLKIPLFFSVLLFAVHPVHTEAVANIKGLDEILTFIFAALTFILLMMYHKNRRLITLLAGITSFILSLLAKESALPLVLAIPAAFYFFRDASLKTVLKYIGILLIPTILYLAIRYQALGFVLNNEVKITGIMNDPYTDANVSQKAGTILFTLLLYVKLLFFPHPLTHDYYPYHIKLIDVYHPLSLLSLVVLLFLIAAAVNGIKNRNKAAWIIFYFFITISIVSNVIINVGAFMNERFLFVPSLAFAAFVMYMYKSSEKINFGKKIWYAFVIIAAIGFGLKSFTRIPAWKNLKSLNAAAVKVSKNSARANCFYGVSLYQELLEDSIQDIKIEKIAEAEKYINKSLLIYPEYADANRMKAGLAAEKYKIDKDLDKLLNAFLDIHRVRHINFLDEFTNWLENRADKTKMADYYYKAGYEIYAAKQKNLGRADIYLQKGLKLKPNQQNLLFGSCILAYLSTNYKQCVEFANKYLNIYGQNADILYYLGNAQIKSGNPLEGNKNLNLAYKIKPTLKNN